MIRSDRARDGAAEVGVLTRYPRPGQVKTRLATRLGAEGAARLQAEMTRHCLAGLRPLEAAGDARLTVHYEGGSHGDVRAWLGSGLRLDLQPAGDMGARIGHALGSAFERGAARAIAVGSDCPRLDAEIAREALLAFDEHHCVLGPATDGGYYMIGLRADVAGSAGALLADMEWSTGRVLAETIARAQGAGLRVHLLRELADVDRPEDLPEWETMRAEAARRPDGTVSVIIPSLDEEDWVAGSVESARGAEADEVIAVDGGSRDATVARAREAGARVVSARPGRAVQMNAGAAEASGDFLVFLHADGRLPFGAASAVREALSDPSVVCGAFAFDVLEDGARGAVLARAGRLLPRLTRHPYGDSTLFCDARTFRLLGGYPEMPVMEDWELVRRMKRLGQVRVLEMRAPSSARSFLAHGLVHTWAVNGAVMAGYRAGVDAERLAAWRRRVEAR